MNSNYAKHAFILAFLSAVGPFGIDMYLPALPTISASLGASLVTTQMTLTFLFVALGLSQLAYGPLSDAFGRKPPLLFGLSLFSLGSIGCAVSPTIEWLIACSVLQGIGAASISVIPRAVIRDLHTGVEATRLMSQVILAVATSSVVAPLVGSIIVPFLGWRSLFFMASGIAVIGLFLTLLLQESRTRQSRTSQSIGAVLGQYLRLFRDRKFLGYSFAGALGNASFFAFLGSSAFVYIHHYNLTPTQYSLAFAVNAIGFIGGAQLAGKLSRRFGIERTLIGAISLCAAIATALALIVASGVDNFALLVSMLLLAYACLGPVIPSIMVLALEAQGETAGVASALAGTFQMVFGGLAVAVVGAFSDGTSFSMVVTIAACALGAAILSIATARRSLSVFHGGTRSVEADA